MITVQTDGAVVKDFTLPANTVQERIILSLSTRLGSFWQRPDFGSKLHLLKQAKSVAGIDKIAIGYVRDALAWMVEEGFLSGLSVTATLQGSGRLSMAVQAISSGEPIKVDYWVAIPADPR